MASPYELVLDDVVETTTDSVTTTTRNWLINFYNIDDIWFRIITLEDLSGDVVSQEYKLYIKFNGDSEGVDGDEKEYGEKFEELQEFFPAQTPPVTPTVNQTALQNLYDVFKLFAPAL